MFRYLYNKVIKWSHHRHAPYYLAGVSFAESSFFPIPPDVMLIPMVLSRPSRAWNLAAITTLFSILGGLLGYAIGFYAFEWLGQPIVEAFHYEASYSKLVNWFSTYGFIAVVLAGFTPIPYKLFTLAAGATLMDLPLFIVGSIVGRGLRFFLVAALIRYLGPRIEPMIDRYIDAVGWGTLLLLTIALGIYWLYG